MREARVFPGTLAGNVRALLAEHGPDAAVDLSCDGYGHGARVVADAARSAGAVRFRVGTATEAAELAAAGLAETTVGTVPDEHTALVYGLAPGSRPAIRLSAAVVAGKRVLAGEGISYGYTYRAPQDGNIALVALGYADGVHRSAGNRATALLAGTRYPVVGRVAMDVFVLFLGDERAPLGAEVVLFGDPDRGEPSLAEWSAPIGAHPLAVTASLGPRVPRVSA